MPHAFHQATSPVLSILLNGQSVTRELQHIVSGHADVYAKDRLHRLASRLDEFCGDVGTASRPLRIAMIPMACDNSRFFVVEALLAVALRRRGHQVRFVLCDRSPTNCSLLVDKPGANWNRQCQRCYQQNRRNYDATGIVCQTFGDLDKSGEKTDAMTAGSSWTADDEANARSSLLRQMQCGDEAAVDASPERLESFRSTIRQAKSVAATLIGDGIDVAVMPDGLYAKYGTILSEMSASRIPVLTHGRGRRKLHEGFAWNRPVSDWNADGVWNRCRDVALTIDQRREIDQYLESRIDQTGEVLAYTLGGPQSKDEIMQRTGLPADRPLDVMFPNLLWDANTVGRHRGFPSQVEWVQATIRWYQNHPGRSLCIKCHPAETLRGSRESVADIAAGMNASESTNIHVIFPDEVYHSHSVMMAADRGLLYTGTVGLELAVMGKPAIVAGRTHYGEKGFTTDPINASEFAAALDSDQEGLNSEQIDLAKKYFHLWAFGMQRSWPFFTEAVLGHVESVSVDQIRGFGTHPTMSALIDEIELRHQRSDESVEEGAWVPMVC